MSGAGIIERLVAQLGLVEGSFESDSEAKDPWIRLPGDKLVAAAEFLKRDGDLEFDTLHCVSGVDWPGDDPPAIEVVYHLTSLTKKHWIVLKVRVERAGASLPTLETVWKAANWHERETYDLFRRPLRGTQRPPAHPAAGRLARAPVAPRLGVARDLAQDPGEAGTADDRPRRRRSDDGRGSLRLRWRGRDERSRNAGLQQPVVEPG